jgi:hypothetical protein
MTSDTPPARGLRQAMRQTSPLQALPGWMSLKTMERESRFRNEAKRKAVRVFDETTPAPEHQQNQG